LLPNNFIFNNRDYAANLATAAKTMVLGIPLPEQKTRKFFCDQIVSWEHDSKIFAERIFF